MGKVYKMEEMNHMNTYYVPTLNRALNDLRVIKEILVSRDKIQSEHKEAKKRADVWNEASAKDQAIRSKDLARKHREVQKEEDLQNLMIFVQKLVLGQLNVVYCANTRRWKKSCGLFASKHLIALEKVIGGWKDLLNEIAVKTGDLDGMSKAVVVETICDDIDVDESEEDDDEKKEVLEDETIGNDVDLDIENDDGMQTIDIGNNEDNADTNEDEQLQNEEEQENEVDEEEARLAEIKRLKEEEEAKAAAAAEEEERLRLES